MRATSSSKAAKDPGFNDGVDQSPGLDDGVDPLTGVGLIGLVSAAGVAYLTRKR